MMGGVALVVVVVAGFLVVVQGDLVGFFVVVVVVLVLVSHVVEGLWGLVEEIVGLVEVDVDLVKVLVVRVLMLVLVVPVALAGAAWATAEKARVAAATRIGLNFMTVGKFLRFVKKISEEGVKRIKKRVARDKYTGVGGEASWFLLSRSAGSYQ